MAPLRPVQVARQQPRSLPKKKEIKRRATRYVLRSPLDQLEPAALVALVHDDMRKPRLVEIHHPTSVFYDQPRDVGKPKTVIFITNRNEMKCSMNECNEPCVLTLYISVTARLLGGDILFVLGRLHRDPVLGGVRGRVEVEASIS